MKIVKAGKNFAIAIGSRIFLLSFLFLLEFLHAIIAFRDLVTSSDPGDPSNRKLSIVVVGTFHNVGWIDAHIRPLTNASLVRTTTVLSNIEHPAIRDIVFCKPPQSSKGAVGQFISRTVWLFKICRRSCPDIIVGYHVMPNALLASVVSRYFGIKMIYQMTSGPVQLMGGGYSCSNRIQNALRFPSSTIQKMLFRNVRRFDTVVVRGREAQSYVTQNRLSEKCEIVTAGIDIERFRPRNTKKEFDLICVSRLVPKKGIEELINVVRSVCVERPHFRIAIVGEGPLRPNLESAISKLKLGDNIALLGKKDNVESYLAASRVFVLLSESEGLSIAMLEAMSVGLPVVVSDVGDLRDFVLEGKTGYLMTLPLCENLVVTCLITLLDDEPRQRENGLNGRAEIARRASSIVIAEKWNRIFAGLFEV